MGPKEPKKRAGSIGDCGAWRVTVPCLAAFVMILLCSKSSPLYPMNDWVDVNCFFTVGRGLRHGLVPYLDLYEQKGPLIYAAYALAAFIREDNFLGVFFLEWICFAVFLHLSGKTAEKICGARWGYFVTASVLAVAVPLTPAFSHGGSAEELALPVMAGGLYIVLGSMAEGKALSGRQGMLLGLLTAAALWTKYTFCGLFAGLAAGTILWFAVRRQGRALLRVIGGFFLGLGALSALVVGWFAGRGALEALWNAYFVNNLTLYGQNVRGGAYDPPLQNLLNNLPWAVPAVLGMAFSMGHRKHRIDGITAWCGAAGLFVFTYLNGRRYPYYALILAAMAGPGVGYLLWTIRKALAGHETGLRRGAAAVTCAALAAAGPLGWTISPNAYLRGAAKEEMPQYRFAQIVHETEEQSLLNSGFLDGGFYFAAGVLPETEYFCTLNIALPEMEQALSRYLREGETAYVVTRGKPKKGGGNALGDQYELVSECSCPFEGRNWTYCLYRRKDLTFMDQEVHAPEEGLRTGGEA